MGEDTSLDRAEATGGEKALGRFGGIGMFTPHERVGSFVLRIDELLDEAEDIGGHRWTFSQSIADADPASWVGLLR